MKFGKGKLSGTGAEAKATLKMIKNVLGEQMGVTYIFDKDAPKALQGTGVKEDLQIASVKDEFAVFKSET
jgi:hypothetical protein